MEDTLDRIKLRLLGELSPLGMGGLFFNVTEVSTSESQSNSSSSLSYRTSSLDFNQLVSAASRALENMFGSTTEWSRFGNPDQPQPDPSVSAVPVPAPQNNNNRNSGVEEKKRHYRGVRPRPWGKFAAEIRDPNRRGLRVVSWGGLLPNISGTLVNPFVSSMEALGLPTFLAKSFVTRKARKAHQPVKGLSASLCGSGASLCYPFLPDAHSASLGARRMLSNQGESSGSGSGSGGRAGGERNGGGGNGNQGIGGGVGGGGGQREGIGNERSGNRGRNHGGGNGNGDDDGNDRGGRVGHIEGERGPMGLRLYGLAETLLLLNAEMIWTLGSHDIHDLSARARIYRVVSLAFNSVALVCLSASIGQRRTNPIRATILSWIGSFATLLGLISMIAMAFSASFIP